MDPLALRNLCIHGHFYQPPREDPITNQIPPEPGAEPYHNWNERIHAECYRPNAELGNFERISFNVGPTLCAWMHPYDPQTCRLIAAQDQANVSRFGVGNAMAQAYNHTILPLASRQDKITQVAWGIADFTYHFGHQPLGMWLPETAVDLETLEVLAKAGIQFTILAPWQADTDRLDASEPYRISLPDGNSMCVFFYHRELSTGISFNPQLTSNADHFAQYEVQNAFLLEKIQRQEPQLVLVASDGELYGHHQKFRDQFLTHLLNGASASMGIKNTFPALWLKYNQPRRAVRIHENTTWSCLHGVTRWMGDCDCTPGDGRWKAYLRGAFNRLAQALDDMYVRALAPLGIDPWELRNRYIEVILGLRTTDELVREMATGLLSADDFSRIRLLLEAQCERQKFFSSCGWYHEDFSRIEPRNSVAYAAQAVRLAHSATGIDLSEGVMQDLRHVVSHRNGLRGDMVFSRLLQRAEAVAESAKKC